ncbi:MAG: sulfatase [Cyclobacteriaceae bacterium]
MLTLFSCNSPKEETKQKPNILFAIFDDASYSHFGAYGCEWVKTPAFDRVANEGILFTRAYTPNAKCAPSRSCILTGRNPWQLEEAINHWPYFPKKFKTYAETLTDNGYHVGYSGKGWAPGIPGEINGVKRELAGTPYNQQELEPPTKQISPNDYTSNFIEFLDANKNGEPFCFWYGSKEPHRRYEYGSGQVKGGKSPADVDKVYSFWPDTDSVRMDMLDYAYEIEYGDKHLGYMLEELEKRGELDNTIVVVTSDNGMPFPRIKGQEYEFSNHLPLAIRWPKGIRNPGRKVDDLVNFIDFAPTFLELAGIDGEQAGMQAIQGKSLTNIFQSEKNGTVDAARDRILIGKERHDIGRPNDWGYPIRGIIKADYLLVQNFETDRWPAGNPETGYLNCDGGATKTVILDRQYDPADSKYWQWSFGKRPELEFYNIKTDPECMTNLADQEDVQGMIAELKDQMLRELKEQSDPRMMGKVAELEEIVYSDKTGTDFYTRYMNGEKMNTGWVNDTDFRPLKE